MIKVECIGGPLKGRRYLVPNDYSVLPHPPTPEGGTYHIKGTTARWSRDRVSRPPQPDTTPPTKTK